MFEEDAKFTETSIGIAVAGKAFNNNLMDESMELSTILLEVASERSVSHIEVMGYLRMRSLAHIELSMYKKKTRDLLFNSSILLL